MQLVSEDEEGEEALTIDRITADAVADHQARRLDRLQRDPAPRLRHPHRDAGQRGRHQVPHRRRALPGDGSDRQEAPPRRSSRRIKVMSELDIAEKRVPQDGRFKLRVTGRTIDFRVSIMPTVHGEDAVIRILDKESANEEFKNLRLDVLGFDDETMTTAPQVHPRAVRHGARHRARPARARRRPSTPASRRSSRSRTRSSRSRTRSSTSCRGITQIPVNEKKGLTFARGPALDPPPRPGQDHGRRDPRRGDGADRRPVGAHRPPRLHDRPRQQRRRRARPVPQHEGRALQLRLGAQLRPRPAAGAQDLRRTASETVAVPDAAPRRVGARPGGRLAAVSFYEGAGCIECNGTGFHGRMAIAELLDLSDRIRGPDPRPPARRRDQEGGQGGGDDLPPRVGAREGASRADDAAARSTR